MHLTDMGETVARLTQGRDLHEDLGQAARNAKAQETGDQDDVTRSLKAQKDSLKGQGGNKAQGEFAELQEPHLTLSSATGIQTTAQGTTQLASEEHIAFTSGAHASLAAGKSFLVSAKDAVRMAAQTNGIKLTAAQGDIDIEAFKDSIHLLAKLDIKYEANRILITGRDEVVVNGGGSATRWSAEGVVHGTPGLWRKHAASHVMTGPRSLPVPPMQPRQAVCKECMEKAAARAAAVAPRQ